MRDPRHLLRFISFLPLALALGCGSGFDAPPDPPTVQTEAASEVGPKSGTLNGKVNPNGGATTTWFEWGPDANYGLSTTVQAVGDGEQQITVDERLQKMLGPTRPYYYRLVAENSSGTVYGEKMQFTTPPAQPPVVTTEAATDIAQRTVVLHGTVTPLDVDDDLFGRFEWGLTIAYGNSTNEKYIGDGQGPMLFDVILSGLAPNTEYHYRAVGWGDGGQATGEDRTFTTAPDDQQSYTLTAAVIGTGSGTVTSSPVGISCGADCTEIYQSGVVVLLTPSPAAGSIFAGWGGDLDCDGWVLMNADKSCSATFTQSATNRVAWYGMEQINNMTIADASGNSHDVTNNGATTAAGQAGYGNALSFNGNDAVWANSNYPALLLTNMSLMAWINPADSATYRPILYKGANGMLNYRLQLGDDHYLYFDFDITPVGGHSLRSNVTIPAGQWTHVAATYDGSMMRLYLNGQESGTRIASGEPKTFSTRPLYLGRDYDQNLWYNGLLDEVKLFNQALTPSEIQAELLP